MIIITDKTTAATLYLPKRDTDAVAVTLCLENPEREYDFVVTDTSSHGDFHALSQDLSEVVDGEYLCSLKDEQGEEISAVMIRIGAFDRQKTEYNNENTTIIEYNG